MKYSNVHDTKEPHVYDTVPLRQSSCSLSLPTAGMPAVVHTYIGSATSKKVLSSLWSL